MYHKLCIDFKAVLQTMLAQTTMLKSKKRYPCILVELFSILQDLSIYYFVAESSSEFPALSMKRQQRFSRA